MPAPRQDKEQIHIEYITTDISVRALEAKYDIPHTTLTNWIRKGKWTEEKRRIQDEAIKQATIALSTEVTQYIDAVSNRNERIYRCADKLMGKVELLLDLDGALSPRDIKSLTAAFLDLVNMHTITEQTGNNDDGDGYTIKITGGDDYA